MICPKCNNNNSDENATCIFCGHELKVQSPFELPVLKSDNDVQKKDDEEISKEEVTDMEQSEEKNIEEPQEEQSEEKNMESKPENVEKTPEELKKDNRKANILCLVAIVLALLPNAFLWYANKFHFSLPIINFVKTKLIIASISISVLIILYVKIKFPTNKLGIILFAIGAIIIINILTTLILMLLLILLIFLLTGAVKY